MEIVHRREIEQMAGVTSLRENGVKLVCMDCGVVLQRRKARVPYCATCFPNHPLTQEANIQAFLNRRPLQEADTHRRGPGPFQAYLWDGL